jgi:ATP-binding cassette subfamily B protein
MGPGAARALTGQQGQGGGPMSGRLNAEKPRDAKGTFLRLVKYMGSNIPVLIWILAFSLATTLVTIATTRLSGSVIDKYIAKFDVRGLAYVCVLLGGLYLFGIAAQYMQSRLSAKLTQSTAALLRSDLFAKTSALQVKFYDTHSTGDLMSRLTNDVDTISQAMSQHITQFFSGVFAIAGTLVAMLLLSPLLTVATISTVPVMLVWAQIQTKISRKYFSRRSKDLGLLNGYVEEIISGIKAVILFSRQEKAIDGFGKLNDNLKISEILAQSISGTMGPVINMLNSVSYLFVAAVGGWLVVMSRVTVGVVFAFLQYKQQFGQPINQIANLYGNIQSALAAAERVFEIMDEKPETDPDSAVSIHNIDGKIEFDNVSFSYVPGKSVLSNASFTADPGQTIAIVGPTGAGKTTIISLLARFYEKDSGVISIAGLDSSALTRDSLRRNIGMVLQDTFLFSESIADNIRYGSPNANMDDVIRAAKLANADSFIVHLPNGYDTILSDNGSNLSQGQRQLLAIARVILSGPQALILDEATSFVDTRTELRIQDALLNLMKGRTSFIIAHRLSTIRNSDNILVIDNGKIVESGAHDELLLRENGFYARLYNIQFSAGLGL